MRTRRSRVATSLIATVCAVVTALGVATPTATASPGTPHQAATTSGNGLCLDLGSPEVKRALRVIGPPFRGSDATWVARKGPLSRSLDRTPNCPPLLWAVFDTSRGTVSSPVAVLLFRPGKFLGLATKPTGYTQVTGSTPVSVTVAYRWPRGTDANANPSGGPVSSIFVPIFDRVYRFGDLPPGVR
ncbi:MULTISPECIES: LppP/LprE family lipoprotein [Gordonia]|uniref:LppP/LprE family lipoprotein n=1 Tax=Gordonia rubripertincta TaxID=36822 RepID=A0AAW4G7W3_GORRU|nr:MULTISPECIES: LppP/LprE family lipoprotein [Gordonia]MBM7279224.1 LppP/LprE family lipoprotein [Gordonia rubripertincta]MCK8614147.1 LppP/LprE family lipoprotein [Gordonia sp. C13]